MLLVSIIIPVYNVAPYIENSLRSALSQTYINIEYIIVDDCGNDNSMDIVAKLKDEYPERDIHIIHHAQNKGLSAARNTGIKSSSGDYLFFMDSDDFITPDCISEHMSVMEKYNVDFTDGGLKVIGGRNIFNEDGRLHYISGKNNLLRSYFNRTLHVTACNKLIRKSVITINNILFKEGIIYEDVEWVLRFVQYANSAIILPQKTYWYIIRKNSITTHLSLNHIESRLYLNEMFMEYINKCSIKDLRDIAQHYLSVERFKYSTLIVNAKSMDRVTRKKYYNLLNAMQYKKIGKGICSLITILPFEVFTLLFSFPRKLYSIIVYSKFGKLFN